MQIHIYCFLTSYILPSLFALNGYNLIIWGLAGDDATIGPESQVVNERDKCISLKDDDLITATLGD